MILSVDVAVVFVVVDFVVIGVVGISVDISIVVVYEKLESFNLSNNKT